MTFTGPDCGLGGWPSQEAAQLLLGAYSKSSKNPSYFGKKGKKRKKPYSVVVLVLVAVAVTLHEVFFFACSCCAAVRSLKP
jgi:hypothetical protein